MSFQTAAWPPPSCALWCSSTLYYHYYFSCCCCFFLLLLFFLLLPILLSTSLIKGPGLLRGPSLSWPCMILTPVLSFAVMLNCLFSYQTTCTLSLDPSEASATNSMAGAQNVDVHLDRKKVFWFVRKNNSMLRPLMISSYPPPLLPMLTWKAEGNGVSNWVLDTHMRDQIWVLRLSPA